MARRVKTALPSASRIRRPPGLPDEAPEAEAGPAADGESRLIYSDNSEETAASGAEDVTLASVDVLVESADGDEQLVRDDDFIPADSFDEEGYLRLNPDVRIAIESGQLTSGYSHYFWHGKAEGRALPDTPREARNVMLTSEQDAAQTDVFSKEARCSVEALIIAPEAGMMIVGWIDDASHPLSCIRVIGAGWRVVIDASRLLRVRRTDVEKAVGGGHQHAYGFVGFLQFDRGGGGSGPMRIELWQAGGFATVKEHAAAFMQDVELRDTVLAHVAGAAFFGSPSIECMNYLERGLGAELVQFNRSITRRIVAAPYVERFGPQGRSPRGTIMVCLHGKAEFFYLQNCLFAGLPGIEDYEFVYVSNSPELAETLLREARSADLIYGLANSIVILPGNAGFGAANNAAARAARSDRLLVVNPDVFPRDRDWARKHTDLLHSVPKAQSRLFGVPLYYDDGSLMHGGIYFEIDVGLSLSGGRPTPARQCRTQHYGKGAPAGSLQFNRPRPVPAVTGAFISIEREWFEQLGGFTEDFIFGHYEDADLCLKSIAKGTAPWIHDIRLWHLEGKGSTRRTAHEGGSIVNRWLFSKTWMPMIEDGLLGPAPTHPLLQEPDASTPLSSVDDQAKRKVAMHKRVSG
jgi:GT2 family glycosyltransferase